jgi:hypothetical protein
VELRHLDRAADDAVRGSHDTGQRIRAGLIRIDAIPTFSGAHNTGT